MAGTIRANGANSARELRRAEVTKARRARANERMELRYYDERAIVARNGGAR